MSLLPCVFNIGAAGMTAHLSTSNSLWSDSAAVLLDPTDLQLLANNLLQVISLYAFFFLLIQTKIKNGHTRTLFHTVIHTQGQFEAVDPPTGTF